MTSIKIEAINNHATLINVGSIKTTNIFKSKFTRLKERL